ncbi:MAG: type II/IV secretion system ATPase subunit [Chloroflexi bacterium]|nr:type II/IV secretion system ATPase subunit [Chloroflexota bacterium]
MAQVIQAESPPGVLDWGSHMATCGIFDPMPPEVKDQCEKNTHLLEYIHTLPTDEVGIPSYYPELTRKMGGLENRNLLYPVSDEVLIHVWSAPGEERDLYIPVEPSFNIPIEKSLLDVETRLIDRAMEYADFESREEREAALLQSMNKICKVSNKTGESGGKKSKGLFSFSRSSSGDRVSMNGQEYKAIKYMIFRDRVGLGVLEPMVLDPNIEDISCAGVGAIFLEHKVFSSMKSGLAFDSHDELDKFVLRLSEQIKRPVTMRSPIVDAVLPDGSRINIVYGREVSRRGSNFTIRKFSDTPLSILELIEFGSVSYKMAAYLSIVLEEGMNAFVSGETASGKTTLMNAITTFVPASAKIVSIEDTPEVQVPHGNWLREVAKAPGKGDVGAAVTMMDLLKAALRQRPNLIIIGEIRGEEGLIAFQAMQTGHPVMATFHASSVEKLIQRLTGHPISVPKAYVDNLNVVIIQNAVKLPNGKMARRATSISEIVGYDPVSNSFSFVEVFRWDPQNDEFEFVGDKNSYLLEEVIAFRRGIPANKKWDIYIQLEKRARVLERLHKQKGITGYYELQKVLDQAQRQGIF